MSGGGVLPTGDNDSLAVLIHEIAQIIGTIIKRVPDEYLPGILMVFFGVILLLVGVVVA